MRRFGPILVAVLFLAGCSTAGTSPTPSVRASQSPSVEPSASASPPSPPPPSAASPSNEPAASPTAPAAVPKVLPAPASAVPLKASADAALHLVPGPDGVLYLALPAGNDTFVVSLDRAGAVRTGWPVRLEGVSGCEIPNIASDGSIRVVCSGIDAGWGFALGADARPIPGWPVDLHGSVYTSGGHVSAVVGQRLHVMLMDFAKTKPAWVAVVTEAGKLTPGFPVGGQGMAEPGPKRRNVATSMGPDGTAFDVWLNLPSGDLPAASTEITAFYGRGVSPGWPITVAGQTSRPAVGPGGTTFVIRGANGEPTSRILGFDASGHRFLESVSLAAEATSEWNGAGEPVMLAPPIVAPDGTSFLVSSDKATTVYAVDPRTGAIRSGWPYRSSAALAWTGYCGPDTAGCAYFRAEPATGPDGTLYLSLAGASGKGGSLVAVASDGRVRSGWPLTLSQAGSAFWSVSVGSDGTVYALAVEPEAGDHRSGTVVAIDPAGKVLYRRTILQP